MRRHRDDQDEPEDSASDSDDMDGTVVERQTIKASNTAPTTPTGLQQPKVSTISFQISNTWFFLFVIHLQKRNIITVTAQKKQLSTR